MFRSIFNPENGIWRTVGKVADVLLLSVLWLFCSLPVFTIGAATAGLYDAAAKCIRNNELGVLSHYFGTFKREFKYATLGTLIWGGVCALLIWGVWTLRAHVVYEGMTVVLLMALWFLVLLIPVGALCWMFPLLSRFTFDLKGLIVTSLRLTMACLPQTFVIVLGAFLGVIVSVWIWVPMLVVPALVAILWTFLMERVFKKYAPPDPNAREAPEGGDDAQLPEGADGESGEQ